MYSLHSIEISLTQQNQPTSVSSILWVFIYYLMTRFLLYSFHFTQFFEFLLLNVQSIQILLHYLPFLYIIHKFTPMLLITSSFHLFIKLYPLLHLANYYNPFHVDLYLHLYLLFVWLRNIAFG